MTLYHWVGISDSSRVILVRSLTTALLLKIFPAQYLPPRLRRSIFPLASRRPIFPVRGGASRPAGGGARCRPGSARSAAGSSPAGRPADDGLRPSVPPAGRDRP